MSRSSAHYAPPCDLPRTPDVHPAVRELVPSPVVVAGDGVDLLRANQRPKTTHVIVWDTETTGREYDARIVEIAAREQGAERLAQHLRIVAVADQRGQGAAGGPRGGGRLDREVQDHDTTVVPLLTTAVLGFGRACRHDRHL